MSMESQQSPYEVRCHTCDVSFPVGTKECIHCGARIGRPRLLARSDDGMPIFESGEPIEEIEEVEPRGGRGLRFGFTAVWLLLALISAAARACQGG